MADIGFEQSIRRLRIWEPDITLLLCELYKLRALKWHGIRYCKRLQKASSWNLDALGTILPLMVYVRYRVETRGLSSANRVYATSKR